MPCTLWEQQDQPPGVTCVWQLLTRQHNGLYWGTITQNLRLVVPTCLSQPLDRPNSSQHPALAHRDVHHQKRYAISGTGTAAHLLGAGTHTSRSMAARKGFRTTTFQQTVITRLAKTIYLLYWLFTCITLCIPNVHPLLCGPSYNVYS